jgi:hypothetical protein
MDQFNSKTEKRRPPPRLVAQKSMEWLRMSMLSSVSKKGLIRILKKMACGRSNRFFWELPYWKDLDVYHSIDVMYVKKNV